MATRSKAGKTAKHKRGTASDSESDSIHEHAPHLIKEAEKVASSVIGQVRQLFDNLTHRVSSGPHADAAAEESSRGAVGGQEASGLLDHVREAGEASIRAIGDGFDVVRRRIGERVAASPTPKQGGGKNEGVAKKKPTAKKKAAAKKKPVGKKKAVAKKKAAAKKKPVARKKAAAKKKPAKKTGA